MPIALREHVSISNIEQVNGKKEREANNSIKLNMCFVSYVGGNSVILNNTRFKTTFSICKAILSIISMHRNKENITEMNYNKNCLQFVLEKRILCQHSNSITVLIKNKIRITSRSYLTLKQERGLFLFLG